MDYFNALIFGVVQGITEFIPISSSGHLVLLHEIIELPIENEVSFDVILHLASLMAVVIFFRKDILFLIKSVLNTLKLKKDPHFNLVLAIVIGTIPAALFGYFFNDVIENTLRSHIVVAITLILGGFLFLASEEIGKKTGKVNEITWKNAIFIGFAQVLALVPGTSRSGITVVAGLFSDLKREDAVRFSFLLSIPVILGASIVKIPEIQFNQLSSLEINILSIAFVSSFVSAIFAIKFFMNFVKKRTLRVFALYRFVLAGIILFMVFKAT